MRRFFPMVAVVAGSLPPVGRSRVHVVPRLVDVACCSAGFERWRGTGWPAEWPAG